MSAPRPARKWRSSSENVRTSTRFALRFTGDFNPGLELRVCRDRQRRRHQRDNHQSARHSAPHRLGHPESIRKIASKRTLDIGETQELNRDNRVILDCDVTATAARAVRVYINDLSATVTNCGVVGGKFIGTPGTSAISFGSSIAGGNDLLRRRERFSRLARLSLRSPPMLRSMSTAAQRSAMNHPPRAASR